MKNLSTITVAELSHYVDSPKLIGFIDTLHKYNIVTLQDLQRVSIEEFSYYQGVGNGKIEKLQSLKTLLNDNLEHILSKDESVRWYQNSLIAPSLPFACGDTLAQDVLRFIHEYIALHKGQNIRDGVAQCIELIFLHGYDIKNTATHCGLTKERVRQLVYSTAHQSFFNKLRQMAFKELSGYDKPKFILSKEFKEKLNELKSNTRSGMLKTEFAQKIGLSLVDDNVHKDGVLDFLNELLDFKIFSGCVHGTRVANDYLIRCNIKNLTKVWGLVFKTLDSFIKPFIKEELISLIQKKSPGISADVINTVVGIIESDQELFVVTKNGPATKYQLRWDALQSMQSRIERILYESKKPLQKQDIKNEYDRRLQMYGMTDPDVFIIRKSKNIFQLYEGGTWIWGEYADCKNSISQLGLVRQYAAEHQRVLLSDVVEHVRKFIPNAEEKSIRALLSKCCNATASDYYIYETCQDLFPEEQVVTNADLLPEVVKILKKGTKYTYQEICDLFTQKYGYSITKAKIVKICSNKDVFIVESPKSRRDRCRVMINPDWDGTYEVRTLERGIQAKWKKDVREEMINKLRYSPNYEMERNALIAQIKSDIPKDVSNSGVYTIFKDRIFSIKEDSNGKTVIALNIKVWEAESKQSIETDNASRYEATEQSLKDIQQKESTKPLYYNMSRTNEEMDHLFSLTKSFISHNLNLLDRDGMGIADVKAAWSYMIKQMRVQERGEENAYYRMLNQLYSYLFIHTTPHDRYYLWVEIRFHFEPYLKSLLTLKGYSICKEDGKYKQLKELIALCQTQHILPNRDENNISRYIGNMLKNRNWKGHNAEDTPNDVVVIQNIQQCLTLYLYTSMRFMQMQ